MFRRVLVGDNERVLLIRKKRFADILAPGEYWIFTLGQNIELERANVKGLVFVSEWADYMVKEQPELVSRYFTVVDTNDSPLHDATHLGKPHADCRLCILRTIADTTLAQLAPIAGRPALRVALGAATPAIEAWYLCGKPPNPSERTWAAGGARGYDKQSLKRAAYGTDRANLPLMTTVAMAEAKRLSTNLGLLRVDFPRGFGALETDILAV